MQERELGKIFDEAASRYNRPEFVARDPIQVPRAYTRLQDIEITAFWTAMLAWGNRVTIINKARELFALMGNEPYRFITEHREEDRKAFLEFKHRTFQATDTLYFLHFLQHFYRENESLESAFTMGMQADDPDMGNSLRGFHELFFSMEEAPERTRKHVSTPARGSACKRLNMFLRWMVRQDQSGVDFGLWRRIPMGRLMIPFDVHVERVARRYGLVNRKAADWQTVVELSSLFRSWRPEDPAVYDFALFGMSALENQMGELP